MRTLPWVEIADGFIFASVWAREEEYTLAQMRTLLWAGIADRKHRPNAYFLAGWHH